jgi:hypothetical protein
MVRPSAAAAAVEVVSYPAAPVVVAVMPGMAESVVPVDPATVPVAVVSCPAVPAV